MSTKLQFLAVHESKVLIIAPRRHISKNLDALIAEHIPLLRDHPIVATYAPLTDLRRFAGILGIEDIAHLSTEFRDARQSLGHNRTLSVPQALLCSDEGGFHMAEMIRSAQANPDLVKIFTRPKDAWDYVAPGVAIPKEVAQFLGMKPSWRSLFGL
jgi:hypothetical protein